MELVNDYDDDVTQSLWNTDENWTNQSRQQMNQCVYSILNVADVTPAKQGECFPSTQR
jgi:hypothetical protein